MKEITALVPRTIVIRDARCCGDGDSGRCPQLEDWECRLFDVMPKSEGFGEEFRLIRDEQCVKVFGS